MISLIKIGPHNFEIYDIGPKDILCPIICLPPCTCDATIYYELQLRLSKNGFRIISINYPRTYSAGEFCESFMRLVRELQLTAVHLVGSSLGGFLAQKFYLYSIHLDCPVKSLILCNTFTDTSVFASHASSRFMWLMPAFSLRMMVEYPPVAQDADDATKFAMSMAKSQLNSMSQADLAARLTMNGLPDAVDVEGLQEADIIIIEVGDLDNSYREHFGSVNKAYPNAKVAHLELGGQFPFLSRAEEFAAYMEMHYESYHQTPFCPTANVDIDGDRI
ncbi:Maspardin [Sparganum proliferum]